MAMDKVGKRFDEAWKEVWVPLEEEYGEVYTAFEDAAQNGMDVLKGLISDEWVEALRPIIDAYVEIPTVTIDAEFEITVPKPNGIEIIREALIKARDKANKEDEVEVKFSYQGAPRYRIDITAPDYYKAEEVLENIAEEILRVIKEAGGEATLIRKEKRIKKVKKRST